MSYYNIKLLILVTLLIFISKFNNLAYGCPPPAILISPINGTVTDLKPTFVWNNGDATEMSYFQLLVCRNPDLWTNCWGLSGLRQTGEQQYNFNSDLTPNTQYYWGVKYYGCAVGTDVFSDMWDFTTNCLPTSPLLLSPANGSKDVSITPTLDWSDVSGATSYDVRVCANSACNNAVRSATGLITSQWSVSQALDYGTKYYWQARAVNICGAGSWANVPWNFTTYYDVAKAPSVTTDLATKVTETSATLNGKVNPNGLSTTYYFEWGPTKAYGNTTPSQSAGSGTSHISVLANLSGLDPGIAYHYRLVAKNSLGTSFGMDMIIRKSSALPFLELLFLD